MPKEGYGFLFPVKRREQNGPSATGEAILNGKTVKVAAWTKTSQAGDKYLSLKFEDYAIEVPPDATDDDIPF